MNTIDRLPNESQEAHQAYITYRDMGVGRSTAKVGQVQNLNGPLE